MSDIVTILKAHDYLVIYLLLFTALLSSKRRKRRKRGRRRKGRGGRRRRSGRTGGRRSRSIRGSWTGPGMGIPRRGAGWNENKQKSYALC